MELRAQVSILALMLASVPAIAGQTVFFGKLHYVTAQNCSQQGAGSIYNSTYMLSNLGSN